ncbi:MAG TPA: hypothetical protein H9869_08010 [Candidatus Ligilactobacillus excrementipullorum]|nr:hypothetical protein [Candidatus Ligilactobacillus excrementipullorum]
MAIFEEESADFQNRNYRQHLNRNWNSGNLEIAAILRRMAEMGKTDYPGSNEVTQARVGVDGTNYSSLNGRLDDNELEVQNARGGYENLPLREANQDNQIQTTQAQLAITDQKSNDAISIAKDAASGSPREAFNSVADLKNKYPNGAAGIYVTKDNGYWWHYINGGWQQGLIYQAAGIADESIGKSKLDFPIENGFFLQNPLSIDYVNKTATIAKNTILSTQNIASLFTNDKEIVLSFGKENEASYVIFDKVDHTYKITESNTTPNTVLIGCMYDKRFYASVPKSKINEYPIDINQKKNVVSFINFKKPRIRVNTVTKIIIIESDNCWLNNVTGTFSRNGSDITLKYDNITFPPNNLPSLYLTSDDKFYVAFRPKEIIDVKVFTIYDGKIYSADYSTQNITIVDDVGDGGWEDDSTPVFKFKSLDEWFSYVVAGNSSKIMWLGDSTWAGYTGPVTGSTTPFPVLIQKHLDSYFGEDKVKSINKSVSGDSITQIVEKLEGFLQTDADTDVLFIGCGLNGVNADNVETRRQSFEKAIKLCAKYNVMPVICTAQAHQVPNVETGDDWGGRSQFFTEKYDRPLRFSIAKKYGLQVLDYTELTQKILDNGPEKISDLVADGLHGSAIMHAYQRDWSFAQIVPTVKYMSDTGIITAYDQKVFASRSLRYVESIERDEDGFKSQWNFDANENDVLMDVWVFLEPEKSTLWNINAKGNGSFKITINDVDAENELTVQKSGLYHIKVLATGGQVGFKGIKCELT